jgi:hypothetical protein
MNVAPTQTTTYTIRGYYNIRGCYTGIISDSVTVTVAPKPTVTISADPKPLAYGDCTTLSWSSAGATAVSIDNGIGTVAAGGSLALTPLQTTTYTITATNGTCATTASVTVIVKDYIISTVAGNGTAGFSGDGGPAVDAQIYDVYNITLDVSGNLYIADANNYSIRKVDTNGVITTIAGTGTAGFSGDGGPAVDAQLYQPAGVAADKSGNIYIADCGNQRIRKVNTYGIITTIAGTGTAGFSGDDGLSVNAQLRYPFGVDVDSKGNIYIADRHNQRIRKVDTNGIITTLAGTGTAGFSGDGGPAVNAQLFNPFSIYVAIDNSEDLYIGDSSNQRVRKVDKFGNITTVAGNGTAGFSGDGGPAVDAQLDRLHNAFTDTSGNFYISDFNNYRIRKVNRCGIITTIAGTGTAGFSGDGGPAIDAKISSPSNVVVDSSGFIYFADYFNRRIRKLTIQ